MKNMLGRKKKKKTAAQGAERNRGNGRRGEGGLGKPWAVSRGQPGSSPSGACVSPRSPDCSLQRLLLLGRNAEFADDRTQEKLRSTWATT